jgi:23S rRNA pseudouridine2605 synthase
LDVCAEDGELRELLGPDLDLGGRLDLRHGANPSHRENGRVRLNAFLARAGVASRRRADELIRAGRVRVNGRPGELNTVVGRHDVVEVDGREVERQPLTYVLLHKPAGVVTTASDPEGRRTVMDLVPDEPRVFPVGRLDFETEGLLLLTNDGALTHRLTHPSFGVEKEYLAEVDRMPSRGDLRRLREGVELDDGMTAPAKVASLDDRTLRITIHEGRNRQVRRMVEAVGATVLRLVRTRIGPLADRALTAGEWRPLTQDEVRALERAVAQGTDPEP